MKTEKQDIDRLIKESLSKEEAEFYDSLDEQSLFDMMGGMYKGSMSWVMIIMTLTQVAAFGFAIYCAVQFFGTDITNEKLTWGLGFVTLMLMVSFTKNYSWMHMNKQAIIRELKRIEYQLAILNSKGS